MNRMRHSILPALGVLALVACSSSNDSGIDSAPSAAPSAGLSFNAAGRQQLKGHVTAEMRKAPIVGRVPASTPMTLTIGLAVADMDALLDAADQVSDPKSPSYRKYVTPAQFADRFGASREDYQALFDWAKSKNLSVETHGNRLVATVSGVVADIETAFAIHLNYGTRPDGTQFYAPDAEPSLDFGVPVDHVGGLENFVLPKAMAGSGTNGGYQGKDFREAYAPCTTMTGAGQKIGIFMFDGFSPQDINGYSTLTGQSYLPVQSVPVNTGTTVGTEGTLDVESALSMAPAAQIVVFTGAGSAILANMADRTDIKQFSSSWFWYNGTTTDEAQLAQMALQGQSYFQATGDGGAYGANAFPTAKSGSLDIRQFPDLTLVGGTDLNMSGAGASYGTLETAWSLSSGGIETSLALPSYQSGIAGHNSASTTNRNVPDVSAQANGGNIWINGKLGNAGGTSEATPLWAGFMALVNQQAAIDGTPSVGFANPAMYAIAASSAYATSFHDVVSGTTPNGAGFQYSAGTGYDLATGLGSPQCGLIAALTEPTAAPHCAPTSTCSNEYFPAGYGSPVGYHTIETISVACTTTPTTMQEYVNGAWVSLSPFVANAGYPGTTTGDLFDIGTQSAGSSVSGAPIGSVQMVRACTSTGCDSATSVTIADCCVPMTCQAGMCGTQSDGCGGEINCGDSCSTGTTCGAGGTCVCASAACTCEESGGSWTGSSCIKGPILHCGGKGQPNCI